MEEKIRTHILHWLSRREHTAQEIIRKSAAKSFPRDLTQKLVQQFITSGLINNRRFAENFITSRCQRGFGPRRIIKELQERGVEEEMIAELMKITDNSWQIVLHQLWQKHFKGQSPRDLKNRAKQMRFLAYRGFTHEQINYLYKNNYDEE